MPDHPSAAPGICPVLRRFDSTEPKPRREHSYSASFPSSLVIYHQLLRKRHFLMLHQRKKGFQPLFRVLSNGHPAYIVGQGVIGAADEFNKQATAVVRQRLKMAKIIELSDPRIGFSSVHDEHRQFRGNQTGATTQERQIRVLRELVAPDQQAEL